MNSILFVHGFTMHATSGKLFAFIQRGIMAALVGDDGVTDTQTADRFTLARLKLPHLPLHPVGERVRHHPRGALRI